MAKHSGTSDSGTSGKTGQDTKPQNIGGAQKGKSVSLETLYQQLDALDVALFIGGKGGVNVTVGNRAPYNLEFHPDAAYVVITLPTVRNIGAGVYHIPTPKKDRA
jgi:hypothetical protein